MFLIRYVIEEIFLNEHNYYKQAEQDWNVERKYSKTDNSYTLFMVNAEFPFCLEQ